MSARNLYKKALTSAAPEAAVPLACADLALLRTFAGRLAGLPTGTRSGDREDVAKALREIDPGLQCDAPTIRVEQPIRPPLPAVSPPPGAVEPPAARGGRADRRSRRPLRVAGGAVLGVGLGVGAGTVAALIRGAALRGRVDAVRGEHPDTTIPTEQNDQFNSDMLRGRRADRIALGLGITAAMLSAAGVALLIADRRGVSRRIALAPLMLPTAGVRLSLEF